MVEVCNGFEGMATRARESVSKQRRIWLGLVKAPALKCSLPAPATL